MILNEAVNKHIEHVEDLIFDHGFEGLRSSIGYISAVRDTLSSNARTGITVTVKFDGAPSIFCGIDPSDQLFFVAKKGIFNKTPKLYKTQKDIDDDLSGDLHKKFSIALKEFSKLKIKSGVIQGDLMFTRSDLKSLTIDGKKYITFQPNTIVYAVPTSSKIARQIVKAQIGVVWHTSYAGNTLETMQASFGKSISRQLPNVSTIWMVDPVYEDYSGVATFTAGETQVVSQLLSQVGKKFNMLQRDLMNKIVDNRELVVYIKAFDNKKVRNEQTIGNTREHVNQMVNDILNRYRGEVEKKTSQKGKEDAYNRLKVVEEFFSNEMINQLRIIYDIIKLLVEAKMIIVNKMNQLDSLKTFLRTSDGFEVTTPEGYVAIDKQQNIVKFVDRLTFSKANFNPAYIKGWQRTL
jgi:hypothetical protein